MDLLKGHPHWKSVSRICGHLSASGFQAFLAGGCVRDGLLGRKANDFDIATNASPEEVEQLFERTEPIGKAFGVILVVEEGVGFEVASFRDDGLYVDGRRPESVSYSTPERDALRRDFTVNALFFDMQSDRVIDYVDGEKDLNDKIVRAVGDPEKRFQEDHLRLLRAVRFAAQLEFRIEPKTWQALQSLHQKVETVAKERTHAEFEKILACKGWVSGLKLFLESQLAQVLLAELDSSFLQSLQPWESQSFSVDQRWLLLLLGLRIQRQDFWEQWRFSRKQQRQIKRAFEAGKQISGLASDSGNGSRDSVILYELRHCDFESFEVLNLIMSLGLESSEYQWLQSELENPVVKAKDLKAMGYSGKKLGELLERCLREQVVRKVTEKEELLAAVTSKTSE